MRKTVDNRSITQGVVVRIAFGVFGLLTIAMLLLAVFNDKGALQVRTRSQKLSTIQNEISNIDAENKKLNAEIQALRSDPTTIEKFAREELKLVKPGDIVLVTPEN
jgi:cell division protein FtsB